jgi:hypothetical protein
MYHTLSGNPVPAIITVLIVQAPQRQIRMPLRQKAFENKGRTAVRGGGGGIVNQSALNPIPSPLVLINNSEFGILLSAKQILAPKSFVTAVSYRVACNPTQTVAICCTFNWHCLDCRYGFTSNGCIDMFCNLNCIVLVIKPDNCRSTDMNT